MSVSRTSHAVYEAQYPLVWAPKYRNWIFRGDLREDVRALFSQSSEEFGFDIVELEVSEAPVPIFLSFPPRYSIARVVGILKSISASRIFQTHPEVKKELWGGEFWEDGYFARTVGDKVTSETLKRDIQYHRREEKAPAQLDLFGVSKEMPRPLGGELHLR